MEVVLEVDMPLVGSGGEGWRWPRTSASAALPKSTERSALSAPPETTASPPSQQTHSTGPACAYVSRCCGAAPPPPRGTPHARTVPSHEAHARSSVPPPPAVTGEKASAATESGGASGIATPRPPRAAPAPPAASAAPPPAPAPPSPPVGIALGVGG